LTAQNLLGQRIVVPFANNADFAINMLDNFTGSKELITLRGRGIKERSFKVVNDLQRAAEIRYRKTEQGLQKKLEELQKKLAGIEGNQKDRSGNVILTKQQQALVKKFRSDMISLRSQLRAVQHALSKDIDALETRLKFLNIAAVPILITIIAFGLAVIRRRRAGRRSATART
jgi:ABC-type uncharacterized transport system involved in gliding motility auxiliary subunit